ncbi:CDP-diacylglycerol synthase [Planoprotostelium fungivorum]|uniref:Phosphatidate cytidylyltransferase n=1 Tax=Planoprotostelium fungivorum TaxID=1890364 RepID=A0A2P6NNS7_9EUKA|nr:CDP-diacylglycerol synthase [Planoprotostelium fungivorum]
MSDSTAESTLRQRKATNNEKAEEPKSVVVTPEDEAKKRADFWAKVKTRSIAGLLMIIVFAIIINSNHYVIAAFVVLIQFGIFREIIVIRYHEAKERKLRWYRLHQWYLFLSTLFWVYAPKSLPHLKFLPAAAFTLRYHLAISFGLYVIGFIGFVLQLRGKVLKYQLGQLTWTLMTLLLLLQSSTAITNITRGIIWFILPASLIICNDIMAYFCGLVAGRKFINRPLTSLSPNKTWEGFIGAFFWTLAIAFFLSDALARFQWMICPKNTDEGEDSFFYTLQCDPHPVFVPHTYALPDFISNTFGMSTIDLRPIQLHSMSFAFFASFIAPFGGFFASAIKRAYKIKDFDSMFPGHGGVTDRMDCQMIMQLFTHVYISTFIMPRASSDVEHIISLITALPEKEKLLLWRQLNGTSLVKSISL